MPDSEALLLVHDHQAQVLELHIPRKQAMGADGDVNLAGGDVGYDFFQLFGRAKTAEHLDAHGERLEAVLEGFEMLEAENGGRREHRHLLAVPQRLEGRAHDDFGFAETDVAAEQPVHGLLVFHVALDVFDGCELVAGFGEFERVLELALPVAVGGEGEAVRHLSRRIELQQLFGHVAHCAASSSLGLLPSEPAQFVELRTVSFGSGITLDEIQPLDWNIETRAF